MGSQVNYKKSIGMSPYQLVYGADTIFPTSLGVLVMKLIQEVQSEKYDMIRRTKASNFNIGDKVLKWDSRREDKGKHGKFDNLWLGPYLIHFAASNNAYFLQELNGVELFWGSCQWQDAQT